ncbi:glycosyltransferase family 2 protein [Moniliophthora roreri]|uniref:Uncharacterized protein n=1 Tax=Moniliophthora roreri TaxID=221103 RepID=A0A0W0GDQ5_MONRR|nr:glycosyltransferase family 2 protein [Moniliophthora roreri]
MSDKRNIILSYIVWLSLTRTAKLLPHLWRRPQDIIYVPAFILFGYYFAVMKLLAGTRAGISDASIATAALEKQNAAVAPLHENEKYPEPPYMNRGRGGGGGGGDGVSPFGSGSGSTYVGSGSGSGTGKHEAIGVGIRRRGEYDVEAGY